MPRPKASWHIEQRKKRAREVTGLPKATRLEHSSSDNEQKALSFLGLEFHHPSLLEKEDAAQLPREHSGELAGRRDTHRL